MPEMISKALHEYGGRQRAIGERFQVEPRHVTLLIKLGRAEVVDETTEGDQYRTRDMTAGEPEEYRRRDLVSPARRNHAKHRD